MRAVKNIEGKDLKYPFNGYTYSFPKGKIVQVEDGLWELLKEILPISFEFNPKLSKSGVYVRAPKEKTRPGFPGGAFGVCSTNLASKGPDGLPVSGKVDKDGVEWGGKGLEDDTP